MKQRVRVKAISAKKLAQHGGRLPWSSIAKRGEKPKARNPKRAASEFKRCYHSRARKAFVRSMPCLACAAIHPNFAVATAGTCDNAHSESGGASYKAHYTTIVPFCRSHHRRYDEHKAPFDTEAARDAVKAFASRVEMAWQAHLSTRCA